MKNLIELLKNVFIVISTITNDGNLVLKIIKTGNVTQEKDISKNCLIQVEIVNGIAISTDQLSKTVFTLTIENFHFFCSSKYFMKNEQTKIFICSPDGHFAQQTIMILPNDQGKKLYENICALVK